MHLIATPSHPSSENPPSENSSSENSSSENPSSENPSSQNPSQILNPSGNIRFYHHSVPMIRDLNLFTHPEALGEVRRLNEQIKIVEGLEHARARLKSTKSLDSNTLSKCGAFVRHVNNSAPSDAFFREVAKLSLDELGYCSISFEERRLKSVGSRLKASDIQAYMVASGVSCLSRREIWIRLKRLSRESEGKPFHDLFIAAQSAGNGANSNVTKPAERNIKNDPEPQTIAKDASSFEFPAARLEMIKGVFGGPIAKAVHHASEDIVSRDLTDCIKSKFPRAGGNAII
ncbi:hypothetical protein F4824DRAFT_447830 [Ustulina deusta]|nr:hypothetical protein F4824DRAFT_447830 [Ustulina deusta]